MLWLHPILGCRAGEPVWRHPFRIQPVCLFRSCLRQVCIQACCNSPHLHFTAALLCQLWQVSRTDSALAHYTCMMLCCSHAVCCNFMTVLSSHSCIHSAAERALAQKRINLLRFRYKRWDKLSADLFIEITQTNQHSIKVCSAENTLRQTGPVDSRHFALVCRAIEQLVQGE